MPLSCARKSHASSVPLPQCYSTQGTRPRVVSTGFKALYEHFTLVRAKNQRGVHTHRQDLDIRNGTVNLGCSATWPPRCTGNSRPCQKRRMSMIHLAKGRKPRMRDGVSARFLVPSLRDLNRERCNRAAKLPGTYCGYVRAKPAKF